MNILNIETSHYPFSSPSQQFAKISIRPPTSECTNNIFPASVGLPTYRQSNSVAEQADLELVSRTLEWQETALPDFFFLLDPLAKIL